MNEDESPESESQSRARARLGVCVFSRARAFLYDAVDAIRREIISTFIYSEHIACERARAHAADRSESSAARVCGGEIRPPPERACVCV